MTETTARLRAHEEALVAFARFALAFVPGRDDIAEFGRLGAEVVNGLPAARAALSEEAAVHHPVEYDEGPPGPRCTCCADWGPMGCEAEEAAVPLDVTPACHFDCDVCRALTL